MSRIPGITLAVAVMLGVVVGTARAQTPEEVFTELRRMQSEGRHAECVEKGRAAAPSLVDMEVVWFVVAQCEAALQKWCEASESVQRFLARSEGASEKRVAEAKSLAADSLGRCVAARNRAQCMAAYERGDWAACLDVCDDLEAAGLPKPKEAFLVRCLVGEKRCDEAKALVLDIDRSTLDPGDLERIERCYVDARPTEEKATIEPIEPPPSSPQEKKTEPAAGGPGAAPWLVGIGGAALATGVVLLVLADADAKDLNALTPSPGYDREYDDLSSAYRAKSIAGHAATWGGAALAGVGLVLLLTGDDGAQSTHVVTSVTSGGMGVVVSGGF